jgi:hypothetical protein
MEAMWPENLASRLGWGVDGDWHGRLWTAAHQTDDGGTRWSQAPQQRSYACTEASLNAAGEAPGDRLRPSRDRISRPLDNVGSVVCEAHFRSFEQQGVLNGLRCLVPLIIRLSCQKSRMIDAQPSPCHTLQAGFGLLPELGRRGRSINAVDLATVNYGLACPEPRAFPFHTILFYEVERCHSFVSSSRN